MADNLRLKLILDIAGRAAEKLRGISRSGADASAKLAAARDALRKLETENKGIDKFRRISKDLAINENALKTAHDKVRALGQAMKAASQPTQKLQRDFDRARQEASRLKDRSQALTEQQERLRRGLVAVNVPLVGMAQHQAALRSRIQEATGAMKRQEEAAKSLAARQARLDDLKRGHAKAAMHTGVAVGYGYGMQSVGRKGVGAALGPVQQFMSHEDAMLGIARQVPGARDEMGRLTEVYRLAEQQVRELSGEIPLATTAIAAMMTASARMEVPTEHLKEQVRLAAEMAIAFDAVPDEIAESMGKVAKNYKMPITDIRGLADAINYLDDNAISKGSDIIDYLNRTSGVISTVSMSAQQAAALGSTLLTLGERAETAGTASNAIIQKLAAATKGTKKFKSAVDEIGMSPEVIQKGMASDAMGTLMKVVEAIRKLPQEKRIGVMVEMIGMEHSDTMAKLVDKPEELTRQLGLSQGAEAQGSMAREAQARYATLSAQWQMAKNKVFDLAASVGETLKPALLDLKATALPWIQQLGAWAKANPAVVSGILKVMLAGSALLVVMGSMLVPLATIAAHMLLLRFIVARAALGFGLLGKALPVLRAIAGAALVAGKVIGSVLMFVGRAAIGFLLTPFGAALALLAGAAYLVWKNWDGIKGGLSMIWQQITTGAAALWQGIVDLKTKFVSAGADLMRGLASGIMSGLGVARDAIMSAGASVVTWFKEKLGIQSPSRVFMSLGEYIPEGAAIGIARGQPKLRAAALAMAALPALSAPALAMAALPALSSPALSAAGPDAAALPAARPMQPIMAAPVAPPMGPAPSVLSQMGATTISITINPAPGQDPHAIARAVSEALARERQRQRSRVLSQLSDIDG